MVHWNIVNELVFFLLPVGLGRGIAGLPRAFDGSRRGMMLDVDGSAGVSHGAKNCAQFGGDPRW